MRRTVATLVFGLLAVAARAQTAPADTSEQARRRQHSSAVTIIRDDWGIAHVYGKTDADTVFGAIYAQAEDDFFRVETNYLNSLGRLAEAEGESKIWDDLRTRMFLDTEDLQKHYSA